ncbi:MAG: lysine--tRNA ligase [Phycisphaerae bacterium]|nr:lysine--tRNA ligase [Phycisphaerae bacterium]
MNAPKPPAQPPAHSGAAPDQPAPAPKPLHEQEANRRANRAAVAAAGLAPYGERTDGLIALSAARAMYDEAADAAHQAAGKAPPPGYRDARPRVKVAGRVMLCRDNGKLVWMTLRDHTGDLQIAVSQRDVDARSFLLAGKTDLGDVLIAEGPLMRTRTGEVTVWCSAVAPAAKCLVPPPEKHAGLADPELRYRHRYVDMWATPETARVFETRSRIVSFIRRHLDGLGYLEVETPMLQTLAGGAAARPFRTHMNALGIDLFLRIAPELYLKRLLVGGMPMVYEINRNFRNEGLDKQHNPEFTMLELYHAHGDVETVMSMTEGLIRATARMLTGGAPARLPFNEWTIDYEAPFERVRYGELFRRALGIDMSDRPAVAAEAARRGAKHQGVDHWIVVNDLFEEFAEPSLDPARPTFITDYPAAISPLTRPKASDPALADRADLFIGRMEIAPHYTELNDPDVQAARFSEQLSGLEKDKAEEENTFRTFDRDFIHALKVGMPPAGGMGLGIDRLCMLLTNQRTIRDVVLFPLMRPQ